MSVLSLVGDEECVRAMSDGGESDSALDGDGGGGSGGGRDSGGCGDLW